MPSRRSVERRRRGIGSRPAVRAVGAFLVAAGCGRSPGPATGDAAPENHWRFADGSRIRDLVLPDGPVAPGASFDLRWRTEAGHGGRFELAVVEPVDAARQVVRYGAEGRRRFRPDEDFPPGASWIVVEDGAGPPGVRLPDPFFPSHAVLVARRRVGPTLVAAVEGPRREDGLAVLGLVEVRPVPRSVEVPRLAAPPQLDGRIDGDVWAGPGLRLVDSRTGRRVERPAARVWFGWTQDALYVAARIDDVDVWATFTERDQPVWKEEAFEVFVAAPEPSTRYVELQVSPRCVLFDAAFTRHRKGGPEADVDTRPACHADATLDRRSDRDRGWSVEWAIPFAALCTVTDLPCRGEPGLALRLNAFVLDRPRKGPPAAAALTPTRVPDFHAMDRAARLELAP